MPPVEPAKTHKHIEDIRVSGRLAHISVVDIIKRIKHRLQVRPNWHLLQLSNSVEMPAQLKQPQLKDRIATGQGQSLQQSGAARVHMRQEGEAGLSSISTHRSACMACCSNRTKRLSPARQGAKVGGGGQVASHACQQGSSSGQQAWQRNPPHWQLRCCCQGLDGPQGQVRVTQRVWRCHEGREGRDEKGKHAPPMRHVPTVTAHMCLPTHAAPCHTASRCSRQAGLPAAGRRNPAGQCTHR